MINSAKWTYNNPLTNLLQPKGIVRNGGAFCISEMRTEWKRKQYTAPDATGRLSIMTAGGQQGFLRYAGNAGS
jgi:hypothetical protein